MSELKFIKGFGQGECQVMQQEDGYVVKNRFVSGEQKTYSLDNLMGAILYGQENFSLVKFPNPLVFKEPDQD